VKILSNDYIHYSNSNTNPKTSRRYSIIINEDEQQSAMSEVDLKSKVGCF